MDDEDKKTLQEENEKLLDDFLGDRKDEENLGKKEGSDDLGSDPEDELDDELSEPNPYDKELDLFEYLFTDSGNVIMSKETYMRLMNKFM